MSGNSHLSVGLEAIHATLCEEREFRDGQLTKKYTKKFWTLFWKYVSRFKILKDIYGVEINNPPNKNDPRLPEEFIKKTFEEKQKSDWEYIQKKYNANYIVVPSSWKINLSLFRNNSFYSIYKIN